MAFRSPLLLAVAVLFQAILIAAPAPAAPTSGPVDGFIRNTEKITDRVWLIYKAPKGSTDAPFEGNSVLIEQTDGLVVVDAGGAPVAGRHIVDQVRKISRKPVKYLIYTHYHGDHNLGAGAFLKAWPRLKIVSTEATRRNMTGPAMDYIKTYSEGNAEVSGFAKEQLAKPDLDPAVRDGWRHMLEVNPGMVQAYKGLKAYPADVTFKDSLDIPDSAAPVQIRFLGRANTDGDAVIWAPKQRVLATGDIVVNPVPYASASFPAEWIAVLQKLKGYRFSHLIPGHGPALGETSGRQYLDKLIWALTEVKAKVDPLVQQGETLEEVQKRADMKPLARSFGGDDAWRRRLFMSFFGRAIVSNAYRETKGEPIIQGKDGGG